MSIIQYICRRCGGTLIPDSGGRTAICDSCGGTVPLPYSSAELFNQGNSLRAQLRFDEARTVFERIVAENPSDAEAHWNIVLCKYGIEYVSDEGGARVPTCNRASYISVWEDEDFLNAVRHSDDTVAGLLRGEAARIEEIRADILARARDTEPFDVFICYKEKDDQTNGRSRDSLIAQEIYDELRARGQNAFFASKTLESMAGRKYEPVIFSALNSAKVMVVVGTRPEHYLSPWVRNEWSRFREIMRREQGRVLIPVYAGMSAYDIPSQLASGEQAVDAGKPGYYQDIADAVERIAGVKSATAAARAAIVKTHLENAEQWMKIDNFIQARDSFEKAIGVDAECADAYWGLVRASTKEFTDSSREVNEPFYKDELLYIEKAVEFVKSPLKARQYEQTAEQFKKMVAERAEERRGRDFEEQWRKFKSVAENPANRFEMIESNNVNIKRLTAIATPEGIAIMEDYIKKHNDGVRLYHLDLRKYKEHLENLEPYFAKKESGDENLRTIRETSKRLKRETQTLEASWKKVYLLDVLAPLIAFLSLTGLYLNYLELGDTIEMENSLAFSSVFIAALLVYLPTFRYRFDDTYHSGLLLCAGFEMMDRKREEGLDAVCIARGLLKLLVRTALVFALIFAGTAVLMVVCRQFDVYPANPEFPVCAVYMLAGGLIALMAVWKALRWLTNFHKPKRLRKLREEKDRFKAEKLIPGYRAAFSKLNEEFSEKLKPEDTLSDIEKAPSYEKLINI